MQKLPFLIVNACLSWFILFQGDIQQLLIVEDPHAAANYCVNYMPDCDSALPTVSQVSKRAEVSTATKRESVSLRVRGRWGFLLVHILIIS